MGYQNVENDQNDTFKSKEVDLELCFHFFNEFLQGYLSVLVRICIS